MSKSYQFQFSENAEKDFSLLDHAIQKRILNKLELYEKSNKTFSFAKKLKGLDDRFSFRVGDYRVIMTPKESNFFIILVVLKVGHRREVYE